MALSFAAKLMLKAIEEFLRGGPDTVLKPTKTITLPIVEEAKPTPASPMISFMDLNGLSKAQISTLGMANNTDGTSPVAKWLAEAHVSIQFANELLYPLLHCTIAGIIGLLFCTWISSTVGNSAHESSDGQVKMYKKLLVATYHDHKAWKNLCSNHLRRKAEKLEQAYELINIGVDYVHDLTAAFNQVNTQFCAYVLWAEGQMGAYEKLKEQFYAYMLYADEPLAERGYEQAITLFALSLNHNEAGDLKAHIRSLIKAKRDKEVELRRVQKSLDAKQRDLDAALKREAILINDHASMKSLNEKYLTRMDDQGKEIEARNQQVRDLEDAREDLEAALAKRKSIFKFDDDHALQMKGKDARTGAVHAANSRSTKDKGREQLPNDKATEVSDDILVKLNLSPKDREALTESIRLEVLAEQKTKENLRRKERRQRKKGGNSGEPEKAAPEPKEGEKVELGTGG